VLEAILIQIELAHTFPVSVSEAFAYITDMKNWAEYWPDFVRIQDPENAHWSHPGDKVTIVIRLLARERALNMRLKEFRKDTRITYLSLQQGLPDAQHERYFKAIPAGFEYRLVVAYEPRQGLVGVVDKLLVKRAIARALRKTCDNLDRIFKEQQEQ
jgi:hypothetical protein